MPQINVPTVGYHLADGMQLVFGKDGAFIDDHPGSRKIHLAAEHAAWLEQGLVGDGWDTTYPIMAALLAQGILLPGEQGLDHNAYQRLRAVCAPWISQHDHTLSAVGREAFERLLIMYARRKVFYADVGQAAVTPETALRRALLVGDAAQVGRKKVVCMGDDDLMCVALAALGHEVTAFDIAPHLHTVIAFANQQWNTHIRFFVQDFRDPFACMQGEEHSFDVFLTDPMSNKACFTLFLSRAYGLLKPNGMGFVAVYGPSAPVFRDVVKTLRLPIHQWRVDHNDYLGIDLDVHHYQSDWVTLGNSPDVTLPYGLDDVAPSLDLYHEERAGKEQIIVVHLSELRSPQETTAMHLNLLVDQLEQQGLVRCLHRHFTSVGDRRVLHCVTAQGHLTLHVDQAKREFRMVHAPGDYATLTALQKMLLAAYIQGPWTVQLFTAGQVSDVRLRPMQ